VLATLPVKSPMQFIVAHVLHSPVGPGGFGGLIPPNKAPSPPNWNMKHCKSVEFFFRF